MFEAKENANAISSMAGTNLVYLKNSEEKPLWLKHNRQREEWLERLERMAGDRSFRSVGLTKMFRFNSDSVGSIGKLLCRESVTKLKF